MKHGTFPIILQKEEEGGYSVSNAALEGCYSQGDTHEEALENITHAIKLHIEDRKAEHEKVNQPSAVSLSTVEVSVA